MTITPAATCSLRDCTAPATDLYHYQWQNRTITDHLCPAHYRQALRNDAAMEAFDRDYD
ncbi:MULTISPECIES: hypothetical protein [Nocardia]|uniref:Uncharacterized protein n=1 Tax=Nocardia farcinica TaxID=37329 RepID=A0A449H6G9_NOCFR|nr:MULTISPECIES: hypothetical protein [Nocardia]MBF6188647.1 hypothetical protein [Nocardia farcinica]UEX23111.1 hypothetical protein LMJ57_00870 [Nocardia farcinica]VFA93566.1 Uncharacterised protein [Nocardia farcinica]